jgi:hypothetical protein
MFRKLCTLSLGILAITAATEPSMANPTTTATAAEAFVHVNVGGYFRLRTHWIDGLPYANPDLFATDPRDLASHADFAHMRIRLNPSFSFGRNPKKPLAKLQLQMDGFDNVVVGDNDLIADTPVFGDAPSNTDLSGKDIDSLILKRAWLEFMIPVGQLRVGRMASQWGLGLLANDGNGIKGDFGDARHGSTNDRVLFATRPLTIFNALMRGDKSETPLVLITAYDKIVEDPHLELEDSRFKTGDIPRKTLPFANFVRHSDDVQQMVLAIVWNDKNPSFGHKGDELTAGVYATRRWQDSSESEVSIYDLFWRIKYSAFGATGPQLFTEAEILNIRGKSRAISVGTLTEPDIINGVVRLGASTPRWDAVLEAGYAAGDAVIADGEFKSRAFHPDYRVGLLMFPIVTQARTAHQFKDKPALWSKGGVYNASYALPTLRYRATKNVELVTAFLMAWADELTPATGGSQRDDGSVDCAPFASDCALGWEIDAAVKVKWGENDLMRWSNELGLMAPGAALKTVLQDEMIWTVQSRIALAW